MTAAVAAHDVTVPAEAATGRVISELAAGLDRLCGRRDALAAEIEEAFLAHPFGDLPGPPPLRRRAGDAAHWPALPAGPAQLARGGLTSRRRR